MNKITIDFRENETEVQMEGKTEELVRRLPDVELILFDLAANIPSFGKAEVTALMAFAHIHAMTTNKIDFFEVYDTILSIIVDNEKIDIDKVYEAISPLFDDEEEDLEEEEEAE